MKARKTQKPMTEEALRIAAFWDILGEITGDPKAPNWRIVPGILRTKADIIERAMIK